MNIRKIVYKIRVDLQKLGLREADESKSNESVICGNDFEQASKHCWAHDVLLQHKRNDTTQHTKKVDLKSASFYVLSNQIVKR